MPVSILVVAKRLDLDAEQFTELVRDGRLDGVKLDESCLQRVRRELFGHRCQPPPKRKGGRHD
jgi:hypothetical protein